MNDRHSRGTNRKLLVALALVVGIGVVIAFLGSGTRVLSFLPLLLTLACPLMMLFMMGAMGHNHMSAPNGNQDSMSDAAPDLKELSREEQVRVLRGKLTRMAWQQEALRHELEQLDAKQRDDPVVDTEPMPGVR